MKYMIQTIIYMLIASSGYIHTRITPITPIIRSQQQIPSDIAAAKEVCLIINNFDEAIMALRVAPLLHAQGKSIYVQADRSLQPLLLMSAYMQLTQHDASIDTYCMVDVIKHINTATEIPGATYLSIEPTLTDIWHDAFAGHTEHRIGIYVQDHNGSRALISSPIHIVDFIPFTLFKHIKLFSFDDITQFSTDRDITLHYFQPHVRMQGHQLAAIINELDLLITSCPSMAALAWMLAKPAWLIQPEGMSLQPYTSYYPGVKIITYTHNDNDLIMHQMMKDLAEIEPNIHDAPIMTEVQIGELIDKMTILEIKTERIQDTKKLENIWRELATIRTTFEQYIPQSKELDQLIKELKAANEALWQTEDLIRDKEREKCFDNDFIRLARSIYLQNDERCRTKRTINELLGSRLIEEKSYKPYN